jgi:cytochrome c biogenesis protein CcmG/thiol:disulfide interchange protein DsbE
MRRLTHPLGLRVALVALLLALLAYGVLAPGRKIVKAPPLPHAALQGGPVTAASLRGHAEAIVFFASWCAPCRREAPAVERFARSSEGHGRLLAIDYEDFGSGPHAFLHHYRWTFPVLSDPDGTSGDAFGVSNGLPTWIFIDPGGKIVERVSGPLSVASLTSKLRGASRQ